MFAMIKIKKMTNTIAIHPIPLPVPHPPENGTKPVPHPPHPNGLHA